VEQADPAGGTLVSWVDTLDRSIHASDEPVVLIAHSLGTICVAHWAAIHNGPVVAALLVAPADVEAERAESGSLYKRFAPILVFPLPFAATVVASTNDPLLSIVRAHALADAWGSAIAVIGDHLHVGSDAKLGSWQVGKQLLSELRARTTSS